MNYGRLSAEIQDFNSKNYKLKRRNGAYAYTSNAIFQATFNMGANNGGLVGFEDPNLGKNPIYFYESGNYKSSFEAMIVDKYSDEIYDGVVLTTINADGKYRLFTIDGGGEGDTETTAHTKYTVEYIPIADIFEPMQKAFGIELVDKVSDEAKEWCMSLTNQEDMHYGYIDDNNVRHQPYDYPVFDTPADNIYVRLCINNSMFIMNFFTSAGFGGRDPRYSYVCAYIDPVEGKTYFPYDLIQFFSNTVDTCGGFKTSDEQKTGNWSVEAQPIFNKTWYVFQNANTPSTKSYNDIINGRMAGRPSVMSQNSPSGTQATIIFFCSDNGKMGRTYTGSRYSYYNNTSQEPAGNWTKYTVNIKRNASDYNSQWYVDSETTETGTLAELIVSGSLNAPADSNNVGFAKASNLIGTKPSTPSNIQSSYATWYNNGGVNLRGYRGVDPTTPYGSTELNIKILPMSIGEDAGADKTQSDVWSGTTSEKDLDTDTPTVKETIKDEGTTDLDSIPSVFRVGAGCYHLYALTTAQIDDLFEFMYTNQTFEQWLGKFCAGDLSKSVVDIYRIPLNVLNSGTDATAIKVGIVSCTDGQGGTVAKEYFNRIFSTHFGSLTIYPEFEDQRDYEPITRCKIFLPFSGFHDISIDDIMGATISLDANVDLISGNGVYSLTVERDKMKAILYTWTFNCRADFPITGQLHRSFVDSLLGLSKVTTGLVTSGAAGGAVGMVAGGAAVMGAANLAKPIMYNGGNLGAIDGFLTMTKPFLLIDRPGYGEPEAFEEIMGRAANTNVVLGAIRGYTQVREVHVDGIDEATAWEKDEMTRLLKSGVIL